MFVSWVYTQNDQSRCLDLKDNFCQTHKNEILKQKEKMYNSDSKKESKLHKTVWTVNMTLTPPTQVKQFGTGALNIRNIK